jgi:hypothetical protein
MPYLYRSLYAYIYAECSHFQVWHTQVPVWALVLSVGLPIIYILPSGFIYAMTGQEITLNILAQIIPGALLWRSKCTFNKSL